jgi:hypothetical protein
MRVRALLVAFVASMLVMLTPTGSSSALRQATWVRTSSASLGSVAARSHGGSVAAGTFRWRTGGTWPHVELYVARFTEGGRELWHRRWHPAHALVENASVALASGGRIVVAGSVSRGGTPSSYWYIREYGPKGGIRWSCISPHFRKGTKLTEVTGVAVARDQIVVAVNHVPSYSGGPAYSDAFLLEFSLSGSLQRAIDIEPGNPKWNETVQDVTVGPSGTIFVSGSADLGPWGMEEGTFIAPNADPFVMALDLAGSVRWELMLHDQGIVHLWSGRSIDLGAGVLAVVADVTPRRGWVRAWRVVRLTTTGGRVWSRTIPTHRYSSFNAEVAVGSTGAISLLGDRAGRPLLRTFRPNGTVASSARVGSRLPPSGYRDHDVDATSAGVFVVESLSSRHDQYVGSRIYRYRS